MKFVDRFIPDCIERAEGLPEGTFNAVLATEGEASDGHILSIKGLELPERTPLLFGHRSQLLSPQLGSIPRGKKEDGAIPQLRVTPRVNLDGEGILADIRRGMWDLINAGDLRGMSIRWSSIEAIRRVNLPSNHPHFVNIDDIKDGDPRRWGMFFKKSRQDEGSVVALGADPGALIGRAQTAKSEGASVFYTALARSVEANKHEQLGDLAVAMDALPKNLDQLRSLGATDADIVNLMGGFMDPQELRTFSYTDADGNQRKIHLPLEAWEQFRGESLAEFQAALRLQRDLPTRREPEKKKDLVKRRTVSDMGADEFIDAISKGAGEAAAEAVRKVTGRLS